MRALLIPALVVGLSVAGQRASCSQSHGGVPAGLSPHERLQAINEVLVFRMARISESTPLDGCSIYLAVGRMPDFLERLHRDVRPRVAAPADLGRCAASLAAHRVLTGWNVRSVELRDSLTLVVEAVLSNQHGSHVETYTLERGAGSQLWRTREVRIDDFAYN